MTTKAKKTAKPTKQDLYLDDLLKSVKGKEGKDAVRVFAAGVIDLVDRFGRKDAMTLYVRAGMLITLAKDEGTPKP